MHNPIAGCIPFCVLTVFKWLAVQAVSCKEAWLPSGGVAIDAKTNKHHFSCHTLRSICSFRYNLVSDIAQGKYRNWFFLL